MTLTAHAIPAVAAPVARPLRVALLLSCDTFESFFGRVLGLDRDRYLSAYRNDWSWYYAAGLLDNNVEPVLYLPTVGDGGRHETDAGVPVRFLPTATWYRPLAPLRRAFRVSRWTLYAQEHLNAAALYPALKAALGEDGIDVLYTQEYWGGRFDHLARRLTVPLVAQDHGGVPTGIVTAFKRKSFARAAAVLSQTRDECGHVERFGGRPQLQPNGCDTAFFHPPADPVAKGRTVLTVARLTDKQKRTSDLIRAMAVLDGSWSLDVVGTGPDRAMLEALAGELGVAARVRFHGFQTREAVRQFCQRCGAYAMPSANEGIPLAVLEAMACGAATVGTRIRSFETVIDHGRTGLLVAVGDVAGLAYAIRAAYADRDRLGPAAAAAVARDFDHRVLYRQLADRLRAAVAT